MHANYIQTTPVFRTVFPVGLLLENKNCLIVGGGKAALHKAHLLLDAKAVVSVVAPVADEEFHRLATAHSVCCHVREFSETDLDNVFLVMMATDDHTLSAHILECCRTRGILYCSTDQHWAASDFLVPAILRKDTVTVSVSSGGQSCRRSRLIKANLSRHIEMVETADLIVVGTSHHQLPIQRREPFHLVGRRMDQTGQMLMQVWGIHEFMLLNTCNRVELIGIVSKSASIEDLLKRIMAFFHLKEDEYYVKRGFEAFDHVAVVCAGLLSQSPGEHHIVAQVKEALDYAALRGWAGGMIQSWIGSALHISKDIRQLTGALLQNREIEDLCLDFLKAAGRTLEHKHIMVLGSGMVGRGLLQRLLAMGHACEWCYHVNQPELPEAWRTRVTLSTFNDLPARLPKVDVIICTAASPGHVLHKGHAPFFDQGKEILIMDLAMPRNVEPDLDDLTPDIRVVDLDGLKRWYHQNILDMAKVFALSKQVVGEHHDLYGKITQGLQGGAAHTSRDIPMG
jgi:glutamyl-tRNA reductase